MKMDRFTYRLVVALCALAGATACQETTVLPTAPSALPPDKVGELTVACPADRTVESLNGVDARVAYPPPRTSGGQAPVEASCSPESGTALPIGTRSVVCTASDALGQTPTCSFSVRVLPPKQISKTRFLAFGDSLTAGVTSSPLMTALEVSKSYPFKLQERLAGRYRVQTIEVVNAGLPGEEAVDGAKRIGVQIDSVRPDVVLIMEGTNDVGSLTFDLSATSAALDDMIDEVRSRGSEAMIATLPPVRPANPGLERSSENIPDLNMAIRSIAFSNGVGLVDVFAAMVAGACPSSSVSGFPGLRGPTFHLSFPCIGVDHVHPTPEGYEVMADAFLDAIVNQYDIQVAGTRESRRPGSPLAGER
jgi:lysophospholipase L1-like esterase